MITFQEAVSQTKALYEEAKRLHGDDLIMAFNKNKNEFWADVHKWDLETLIASAATKPRVFDILVLAISKKIEEKDLSGPRDETKNQNAHFINFFND